MQLGSSAILGLVHVLVLMCLQDTLSRELISNRMLKSVSNKRSCEICDNTNLLTQSTAIVVIRGHFHMAYRVSQKHVRLLSGYCEGAIYPIFSFSKSWTEEISA